MILRPLPGSYPKSQASILRLAQLITCRVWLFVVLNVEVLHKIMYTQMRCKIWTPKGMTQGKTLIAIMANSLIGISSILAPFRTAEVRALQVSSKD
jgi:hypothetical protein